MADEPDDDGPEPEPEPEPKLTRDDLDTSSPSTRSRIFLAVLAALVVGVIIGRVTAGGDDDGGGGDDDAATATTAAQGLPFPAGDQDRTNFWGFAGLVPVVADTFDRDDRDQLGSTEAGETWEELQGTWGISQRQAEVDGSGQAPPSIAVLPGAEGAGLVEVTMPVVEGGAGLVFRYAGPANYWSIVADPTSGTWSVFKTIEGETDLVSDITASTDDGVTVSTIQQDQGLRILIDGEDVLLIEDRALGEALRGGLIASPDGEGAARWDRFLVMRFRPAGG